MATQLKSPDLIRQNALQSLFNGQQLLNKSYLATLGNCNLRLPVESISYATDLRLFKVERIVVENKQSILESLTAAYTALGSSGYSVFLFLKSNGTETDVYLGVRGVPKTSAGSEAGKLLEQVFQGHFSGSHLSNIEGRNVEILLNNLGANSDITPSVTAVTGVPSLALEEREHFMQGIEHFIDAAEGKVYQALILAEPVSSQQLDVIQRGYEGVATQLSPLLKQSVSFGENESESVSLSIGESINHSFGTSLSLTETKSVNESISKTETFGTNESFTTGKNESTSNGTSSASVLSKGIAIAGTVVAAAANTVAPGSALLVGLGTNVLATAFNKSENHTVTTGTSVGHSQGTSKSDSTGITKGSSSSSGTNQGVNTTDSFGTNQSQTINNTLGSSRQITLEMLDKGVEQLLKRVDHQLERVEEAKRYGGWNTAAYFIGDSSASSRTLASIFLGLMRGNNSNSEDFALTTWSSDPSKRVLSWLTRLTHPRLMSDFSKNLGIEYLTPATLVSGKEMAVQLGLPRRSTSTVTVVESQSFGRSIQTTDTISGVEKASKSIHLGTIRHLWQDTKQAVDLDVQKLSSHIFVTGSTGSGKSNTVYQILDQLNKNDVKFMVIEPAKGEYKSVFGERAKVFGTNPKKTELLRINPFKFPSDIHVLEHIDRLIEIFNVCWPMYAAMPAILKDAMLEAYKASGWNLENSYNLSPDIFPSFSDLLKQLEKVIANSAFAQELKSNYEGSLVTRVRSLTNGLNGQIFSANEVDNSILFDENVIVDLSRIGSQETKSLIMGILVMRLSEYRMSCADGMDQPLRHVTVLEEAHNILKRTSTEQSAEGSNVAGKAVEMLSNAIAEMRTYGEGFIIADQSPSAVDISAIRNTNTKIVMRLPDEADRRLAGKASGVTDEQLEEIAKLPKGVAVVYQNDWLEPVLCQIAHFDGKESFSYVANTINTSDTEKAVFKQHIAELLFSEKLKLDNKRLDFAKIQQSIEKSDLSSDYKSYLSHLARVLQQGHIPALLYKPDDYLISLYEGVIREPISVAKPDLSVELQNHFNL